MERGGRWTVKISRKLITPVKIVNMDLSPIRLPVMLRLEFDIRGTLTRDVRNGTMFCYLSSSGTNMRILNLIGLNSK